MWLSHVETGSVDLILNASGAKRAKKKKKNSVLRSTATNSLKNIGMLFKI